MYPDNNMPNTCGDACGTMPECAPLAVPYVPFQQTNPKRYSQQDALNNGTLFPGLNLPFRVKPDAAKVMGGALAELQALEFVLVELEMSTACWLYTDSQRATAALTVTEDQVSLKRYDPYAEGALTLPGNGLVLEESLANELGLRAGDRVTLRFAGDSRYYSVPVAEVNRCVSGVCLSRSLWRGLGLAYTPTAAYLTSDGPEALAERLGDYDFVDAWQTRQAATAAAVERLSSMSMVVYILILFGGGLACIVIYNLGIMSFFEQLRSLATLMVLGFYEKEIKTLQLSENIIFAVCGILLGIPLGVSLNRMILASITTMPLMEATRPASLALSCAVTLLFALAVNVVIGRKMREIDMLGALKSVE